ncbi:PucR family transcriptional regulator [Shouchella shacheensis]|uniref:PucR family transcriptional regulator n=1 Tax=Shouchella shacheensis TaxID=1649580 RepID=UPI001FDF4A82|nr:PucR family transcriptional regulator [Shouchella shacheensis]
MFTLEQVMSLDIMKPAVVKTGADQLEHRSVEWVSITEAPVENFVRKNELVLTTGIGYAHDPNLFYEFVRDVIISEASGLAVAAGRYIYELYDNARELAEKHGFPIIFLPWEVRFADVTQAVTAKLTDARQEEWQQTQRIQQELLSLMLAGSHLSVLAEHVAANIGGTVVITDRAGRVKGQSGTEDWYTFIFKARKELEEAREDELLHDPLGSKVQTIALEGMMVWQLPIIQAKEHVQGYLYAISKEEKVMEAVTRQTFLIILEHAVTAAAFWFLQESTVQETEARLRDDFVTELAEGTMESKPKLSSRAAALGYDLKGSYIAIVGYPENMRELYNGSHQTATYEEWQKSMVHYMEEEVYYAGTALDRRTMSTFLQDQLLVFLEVPEEGSRKTVNSFLDLLYRRLTNLLPNVELSWGIGDHGSEPFAFHMRYKEARQALMLGVRRKGAGSRVFYSETRVDRVLVKIGGDAELRTLMDDYVIPLVHYDKQRSMDLIGTFNTYQRNQNKVTQTARVLHLHRQSLLYRLRKIESLTGLSLANPDDVFLLDLSIRIWMIREGQENAFN